MSKRHAVLCCALICLSLVVVPAARLVRAAGTSQESRQAPPVTRGLGSRDEIALQSQKRSPGAEPTPTVVETAAAAPPTAEAAPIDARSEAVTSPSEPVTTPEPAPTQRPVSLLEKNQIIVFYGTPLSSGMGILGMYPADEAATRVKDEAVYYDQLNGDERGAQPAMDLIFSIVQAEATGNGLFLRYLPDDVVREYLDVAEKRDVQLILDLQIGRGGVLDEVKKIEPYLKNARVHVAIDPEYAVGSGGVPIYTPGRITGAEINAVQAYLAQLTRENNLAPKLLIVHQYLDDTIVNGGDVRSEPGVDLVINMDGIGEARDKIEKYQHFAKRSYAEYRGFNVFLNHDNPPMTERDVLKVRPLPNVVFYQ